MSDAVLVERDADIATVVLNRPDRMNALNGPMWVGLRDAMQALSADDGVRCVILRGAGEEAFCPGHDINEFQGEDYRDGRTSEHRALIREVYAAVRDCRHPTLAMIHGVCTGGGLALALVCDLRISGQSGRFGLPINRIGVALSYPLLAALIEVVGKATALELLLEARIHDAQAAARMGLVTRVLPDAELEAAVRESARRIADGAPLVNRWHKSYARRLMDPRPITEEELEASYACFESEDFRRGTRAFLDKTTPEWTAS